MKQARIPFDDKRNLHDCIARAMQDGISGRETARRLGMAKSYVNRIRAAIRAAH